jgi:hypothetical protein
MGLNFKLDVGLYRLDQQVACQRIDETTIDATATIRERIVAAKDAFVASFAPRALATA